MNKAPKLVFAFLLIFLALSQGFAAPRVATYDGLLQAIRAAQAASQARITVAVEQEKVREAWETGRLIDEHILHHKERAEYGEQVIIKLAKDLETSETELKYMLQFARTYPIRRPADELSWSHYQALLSLNDPAEREEVAKEAVRQGWSRDRVREEVRRRRSRVEGPLELPEIMPGPLNTYKIICLKDRLRVDLGFGIYHDLPEKDAKKFKAGDIIVTARRPEADEAISLLKDVSPFDLYTYQATVTQGVDGDTFHALIDLGFGVAVAQRVRLRRIDAPELVTGDGKEAKAYLEKILSRDKGRIILQSRELDQHGRPIADVWIKNKPIDQELLDEGLAVRMSE